MNKVVSKKRLASFALVLLFISLSFVPTNAAVKYICVKGSKAIALPASGKCSPGYSKVSMSAASTKNSKKPCTAAQLFKLQDVKNSMLKAKEQIEIWNVEISNLLDQIVEYQEHGQYVRATMAQDDIGYSNRMIASWQKQYTDGQKDFQNLQKICVNKSVVMP